MLERLPVLDEEDAVVVIGGRGGGGGRSEREPLGGLEREQAGGEDEGRVAEGGTLERASGTGPGGRREELRRWRGWTRARWWREP